MIPREAFSGISPAIESLEAARAALMQAVAAQRSEQSVQAAIGQKRTVRSLSVLSLSNT